MTPNITAQLLQEAIGCTAAKAAEFAPHLSAGCAAYSIDNPARIAAFFAQTGHESGSFRYVEEIWGPTDAQKTYEGRANLGNTQPGDGERFKGHGLIQITGRYNHARVRDRLRAKFGDSVPDFEAQPEALAQPVWAALSACDYWDDRKINPMADAGDFKAITRAINGALNGLDDRIARWNKAKAAIAAHLEAVDTPVVSTPVNPSVSVPVFGPTTPIPTPISLPVKEKSMAPFVALALPYILDAVPKLASLFSSGSDVAKRNEAAATQVVQIAKDAIQATNEQDLVEKMQNDPAAQAAVQKAIQDNWFAIQEATEKSIGAAREANAIYAQPGVVGFWMNPAFWVSSVLLLMPFLLIIDVFFIHPANYDGNLKTQIVTALLVIISMIGSYWLGTSASSQRKTELAAGATPQ